MVETETKVMDGLLTDDEIVSTLADGLLCSPDRCRDRVPKACTCAFIAERFKEQAARLSAAEKRAADEYELASSIGGSAMWHEQEFTRLVARLAEIREACLAEFPKRNTLSGPDDYVQGRQDLADEVIDMVANAILGIGGATSEIVFPLVDLARALSDPEEAEIALALARVGVISGEDARRLEEAMERNSGRAPKES